MTERGVGMTDLEKFAAAVAENGWNYSGIQFTFVRPDYALIEAADYDIVNADYDGPGDFLTGVAEDEAFTLAENLTDVLGRTVRVFYAEALIDAEHDALYEGDPFPAMTVARVRAYHMGDRR